MSTVESPLLFKSNPVWKDAVSVMDTASRVRVNLGEIERFAETIDSDDFELPHWDAPVFPAVDETPVHDQFLFLLVGNSLNYCFNDVRGDKEKFATTFLGGEWEGAFGMWAALKRSLDDETLPNLLSSEDLQTLTESQFLDIFQPDEGTTLPLVSERTAALNEIGSALTETYEGDTGAFFNEWFPSETISAREITENVLSMFSSFIDESECLGETTRFQKRAQLLPLMLAGYWQDGPIEVTGTDWLTLPADYGVPATLRGFNLIEVTDEHLAERIAQSEEVEAHSPEEVELRAATIVAGGVLYSELAQSSASGVSIPELDFYLWSRRNEVDVPTHRTLTTAY